MQIFVMLIFDSGHVECFNWISDEWARIVFFGFDVANALA